MTSGLYVHPDVFNHSQKVAEAARPLRRWAYSRYAKAWVLRCGFTGWYRPARMPVSSGLTSTTILPFG